MITATISRSYRQKGNWNWWLWRVKPCDYAFAMVDDGDEDEWGRERGWDCVVGGRRGVGE